MRQADISIYILLDLTDTDLTVPYLSIPRLIFAHKFILPIDDMGVMFESINLCAYESVSHFIYPFRSHDLFSAVNIPLAQIPVY